LARLFAAAIPGRCPDGGIIRAKRRSSFNQASDARYKFDIVIAVFPFLHPIFDVANERTLCHGEALFNGVIQRHLEFRELIPYGGFRLELNPGPCIVPRN
jgi:hypothetical protein